MLKANKGNVTVSIWTASISLGTKPDAYLCACFLQVHYALKKLKECHRKNGVDAFRQQKAAFVDRQRSMLSICGEAGSLTSIQALNACI